MTKKSMIAEVMNQSGASGTKAEEYGEMFAKYYDAIGQKFDKKIEEGFNYLKKTMQMDPEVTHQKHHSIVLFKREGAAEDNVERTFFSKLLEQGLLPSTNVKNHNVVFVYNEYLKSLEESYPGLRHKLSLLINQLPIPNNIEECKENRTKLANVFHSIHQEISKSIKGNDMLANNIYKAFIVLVKAEYHDKLTSIMGPWQADFYKIVNKNQQNNTKLTKETLTNDAFNSMMKIIDVAADMKRAPWLKGEKGDVNHKRKRVTMGKKNELSHIDLPLAEPYQKRKLFFNKPVGKSQPVNDADIKPNKRKI